MPPTSTCFGRWLTAALLALACVAPLQAAEPALSGRSLQGQPVSLAALKGKVVLLFFWSTDCPVCLDKLPELRRNLDAWRGKDLVILAVSQDRDLAKLQAYQQVLAQWAPPNAQMALVWRRDPAHRDTFGELPTKTPTSILIDRRGQAGEPMRGRIAPELWDTIAEMVLN